MSEESSLPKLRDRALGIVATGTILAILYFGREVLVPITLAVILSLLISPLVRVLRRLGLGPTSSVLAAVLVLTMALGAVASVIGVQVAHMVKSLPQYERTIRHKLYKVNELTVDRLAAFTSQTERLVGERREPRAAGEAPPGAFTPGTPAEAPGTPGDGSPDAAQQAAPVPAPLSASPAAPVPVRPYSPVAPIPVEVHQPPLSPLQVVERVLGSMWVPLETAGIVIVVLIFVLLERESVRDRFIRLAGPADLRATTLVLNDAGERLSRFFVSQFLVNLGVGVALWLGLALIGLPHATLWAALAAVLRFVPYVGVWIAAVISAALAAAVDPGWTLVLLTLGLFVVVELIAGQLVEPQLYGHSTGLSPLSVVVAAIFWSWIWGPVGLVVSTPLTLCLVVMGRHVKALRLLDIMLGDSQALTMPERFYQRALSADSDELIANARAYLKHDSLAAYSDFVLMPALRLAAFDLERRTITREQQLKVRQTIVTVIAAISGGRPRFTRRRHAMSMLDQMNAGRQLRQQREQLIGRWQGPLAVPPGSIMLCLSMGSMSDDLATELLVRILRDKQVDARHVSLEDLKAPPPEAVPGSVSMVFVVSSAPGDERQAASAAMEQLRARFAHALLIGVCLPGLVLQQGSSDSILAGSDKSASSLVDALQICMDWLEERTKT
jgi:predicted PurR-regulated permease PerM